jgi:fatty-acyl-CoA synthase
MLAGDILRRTARRAPRRTAVTCRGARVDYATLDADADRLAHALLGLGLPRGARVAILASNVPEYAVVHFGAARSGLVLAHLSTRCTPSEIAYMLDRAEARALVVEADLLGRLEEARPRLPRLGQVVVLGGAARGRGIAFADFVEGRPAVPPAVDLDEREPYAMTFTGGTTGLPKAVVVSHRARAASALIAALEFGLDERDVVAVATPLFHTAGLFVWFQAAVLLGAACALLPRWSPEGFVELVAREGVTAAMLVPTQLHALLTEPGVDLGKLAGLRKVNYAAAPMPPALFEALRERLPHVEFTEHYGQSEAAPLAVRHAWHLPDKRGSVGRACVGVELALVDPEGRPVAPGEVGEVVTRGEHLLAGYHGEPEQTAALFKTGGGWLWTGDLGVMDDDGFLTLVGRSRDMIISGGENVYPQEIENALAEHAAVGECAVFGIPDERWGEVPAAHVVLRPGARVTEEELVAFCLERVARHKRPRLVRFVDALPKTAVGKVQKNLLRDLYAKGRA